MYRSMVSCNPKNKGFLLYAFQSSIFLFFYSWAALYAFTELQSRTYFIFTIRGPHETTFVLSDYRAALNRPNPVTVVILMSLVNQSSVAPFTDRFIYCNPRTARKKKNCVLEQHNIKSDIIIFFICCNPRTARKKKNCVLEQHNILNQLL